MRSPSVFSKYTSELEAQLRTAVRDHGDPLYDMLSYQLGWRDEQGNPTATHEAVRLRGCLCLLCCEALSGDYHPALPAAASLELIYQQALVHEDVQVAHPERDHRPTLWWLWGPGQAINAGDGLHALGRLALLRLGDQDLPSDRLILALEALDRACIKMYEGQHADLLLQERLDLRVNTYMDIASARTGALFGCAAQLGCILATNDPDRPQQWYSIGMELGMAYHVRSDILELWSDSGSIIGTGRLLSKKKNLPIAFALERAEVKKRRELGTLYLKRVLEPADVDKVLAILEEVGARQYAQEMASEHQRRAMAMIEDQALSSWAVSAFREVTEHLAGGDF